jgi:hypothetical protein
VRWRWDIPIRLLGALHYLALTDGIDPWSSTHDVLVERREWISAFISEQDVQTNEVGRCFALLPAFLELARVAGRRIDLLELGPSAGLNLLFDRYRYVYANGEWGDETSQVVLDAEERTPVPADVLRTPLEIGRRRGIDLNPIDVRDDGDVRTLLCFVWADQWGRIERLKRAVAIARREPPELIRGDYVDELPRILAERDDDAVTVVFQTASTQYLPRPRYDQLRAALQEASRDAPLGWISTQRHDEEVGEFTGYALERAVWPEHDRRLIAFMGYHGEWLDYVA